MSEREHDHQYQQIRRAVLDRDNYTCQDCGNSILHRSYNEKTDPITLHVHHIVPKSSGGSDNPTNLLTLCQSCHQDRHSHHQRTFPEEKNPPENISQEEFLPYPCPHDTCDRRFEKEVGLRTHYSVMHGKPEDGLYPWQRREIYIWFNCPNCDEIAERKLESTGEYLTFCSESCHNEYLSNPETPSASEFGLNQ